MESFFCMAVAINMDTGVLQKINIINRIYFLLSSGYKVWGESQRAFTIAKLPSSSSGDQHFRSSNIGSLIPML